MPASAAATASVAAATCAAVGGSSCEMRTREAERAEVGRPDPGGAEQRGADRDLGGAAADVDDRDDLRQLARRPGDGAVVGEPALAVGGEDADGQAGRLAERCREGRRRGALAARAR